MIGPECWDRFDMYFLISDHIGTHTWYTIRNDTGDSMPKRKRPYTVVKVGRYWHYRLGGDPKRIKRTTGQTRKGDAEDWVEVEILGIKKAGAQKTPTAPALCDWGLGAWDEYGRIAEKPPTPRYAELRRKLIDRYIIPDKIALRPMDTLTKKDVLDFRSRMITKKLADKPSTAEQVIGAFKWLLKYAHEVEEIIQKNPAGAVTGYHVPKSERKTRETYSETELAKLFPPDPWTSGDFAPWTGSEDYTAFLICASTGMRKGEVLGLHWDDYVNEPDAEHFNVVRQIKDRMKQPAPLKNGKPRRTILFDWVLWPDRRGLRALNELSRLAPTEEDVVGIDGDPQPTGYLFHDPTGEPRRGTWWQKHLHEGLKRAGIERDRGEGKMKADAHAFRHSLASFLRAAGIPDATIREHCGWSSEAVQAIYSHTGIDQIRMIRENAMNRRAGEK